MSRSWVLTLCVLGCAPSIDGEHETAARAGHALITAATELSVPRPPGVSTTPGSQRAAIIRQFVSMSGNHLVLWEDDRRGELDLYSAIIDLTGTRIGGPTLVAGQPGDQHEVAAACGSGATTVCFGVWVDDGSGLLIGARLDADGKVVGVPRAVAPRTLDRQVQPAVAWLANDNYLVAWVETRNVQRDLFVALINATVGTTGTRLPVEDKLLRFSHRPSLAVGRGMVANVLLTWEETAAGIVGTRLDTNSLSALDDPPLPISAPPGVDAGVAWPIAEALAGRFQVVWAERGPDWDLYGAQVFFDGGVTAPRALSPTPGDQITPSLSGSYLVWADNRNQHFEVYGSQLSAGMATPASVLVSGAGDQGLPSVLFENTVGFMVWTDGRGLDGWPDIYATRFTVPLGILNGNLISEFPPEAQSVSVASQRGVSLLVWEDSRDPSASLDLYGMLVVDGRPDGGFPIVRGPGPQGQPAVAAGPGGEFFVVFADGLSQQIQGVLVTNPLAMPLPVDVSGTVPGKLQVQPAVAWNGSHYTVVYLELPSWKLSYTLVTPGNAMATPPRALGGAIGEEQQPAVAASVASGIALVAWAEKTVLGYDIYARRLSPMGTAAEPFAFAVAVGPGDQQEPAVGTDGRDFLIVWRDGRGLGGSDLWGVRVPATGSVANVAPVQLTDGPSAEVRPGVAYDGKDWVVSWQDPRDAAGVAVWAERVAPDLSHFQPELVATGLQPAIAIGPGSSGLIGYHRPAGAPLARQAFMKHVLAAGGASCVGDSSCQSSTCTGGICVDVDAGRPVRIDAGFIVPDGGVVVDDPRILENANASATVGRPYRYNDDERVLLERGTPPVAFGACDTPPTGFAVDPGSGTVKWTPDSPGVQRLCVFATNGQKDEYRFEVTVAAALPADGGTTNPTPLDFQTRACECGTSGGLLALAALFSLFKRGPRRNRMR